MNLLLLTHRTPFPPDRGDRIRSYHLLRYLSRRTRVSLGSVAEERPHADHVTELQRICTRVAIEPTTKFGRAARDAWSLASGRAATEGHFWSPRLARQLCQWAQQEAFDAVVCFCSGMYRYTQLAPLRNISTVVDLVDVDSQKWADCAAASRGPKSWVNRLESRRVRSLENTICRQTNKVLLISDAEREVLRRSAPHANPLVAGNGVDTDYFAPNHPRSDNLTGNNEPTCCFVGVLNYQPNVDGLSWFVEHCWPLVRQRTPGARLQIVGRHPNPRVKTLAQTPGVELHADVPDVRPFLAGSAAAIAPLRIARGVQNKVLEAMAMGLPVVVSPAALTGIAAQPGEEILTAANAAEWSAQLDHLFHNAPSRHAIGSAARQFVLNHHSWDEMLAPFGKALGLASPSSQRREAIAT